MARAVATLIPSVPLDNSSCVYRLLSLQKLSPAADKRPRIHHCKLTEVSYMISFVRSVLTIFPDSVDPMHDGLEVGAGWE